MNLVMDISDRIYVIDFGKLIAEGTPAEVQDNPEVIRGISGGGRGMSLLKVTDLKVSYGGIEALKGISFAVKEGEIVTLIGANGAGKSTALRSISGLVSVKGGTIEFAGEDITGMDPQKIVSRGIAMVPEGRRVFPNLTVAENLKIGAYLRKDEAGIRKDMDHVYDLFPRLQGALLADGRHALRRRAADAGRGPGADGPPAN